MMNIVDSGGSSIVLSISAAPSGRSRWNSSRISTLREPLRRREGGDPDDLAGLLGRDRGTGPPDLADVGVLTGERQPGVSLGGVVSAADHPCGECTRCLVLGGARRSDEEVGVHRTGVRCCGEPFDRVSLTDDVVPHRVHRSTHSVMADSTSAPTCSIEPTEVTVIQRVGSAAAIVRNPLDDAFVERITGCLEAVEVPTGHARCR